MSTPPVPLPPLLPSPLPIRTLCILRNKPNVKLGLSSSTGKGLGRFDAAGITSNIFLVIGVDTILSSKHFAPSYAPPPLSLLCLGLSRRMNAVRRQGKGQDVSLLLGKFKAAQERHVRARREAIRKKSLQSDVTITSTISSSTPVAPVEK